MTAIGFAYGAIFRHQMGVDLRLLQSFVTVIEEGSLSAASRRCHVSQPALSQQMQALEEELGEPLLHRRPRGVEPTAAGELLLQHARTLLAQAERLRGDFESRRELESGEIRFGIIPTLAPYLLPQWLGPFRKSYPAVRVMIEEARTRDLLPKVVDGSLEFAILSDVTSEEKKLGPLQLRELFREPLLLAAPNSHPLVLRKSAPTPADVVPEELIHLSGGHCLAERTLRLCRIRQPDAGLRCDQIATALSMTLAGMGVTIVPKLAVPSTELPGLTFQAFAGEGLHRVVHWIKRRDSPLSPAAAKLIAALSPNL